MQIAGLSQWVNCQKVVKLGKEGSALSVTR